MASSSLKPPSKVKLDEFLVSYHPYQNWSMPDSVTYQITKNPSSAKGFQKLLQSCKYFFVKNPIIVAEELGFNDKHKIWVAYLKEKGKRIDFVKFSRKLWVSEEFRIFSFNADPNLVSSIFPHLYQNGAKNLHICNQILSFKEFLILSSNVEELSFYHITVKENDGSIVPLQKLIKNLHNVKTIEIYDSPNSSCITSTTVIELLEIPHFLSLKKMELKEIPDTFDIETFFDYAKKNKTAEFLHVNFNHSISEAYKHRLEVIVDEMIETLKNFEKEDPEYYRPPFTFYIGIDEAKLHTLETIFYGYEPT